MQHGSSLVSRRWPDWSGDKKHANLHVGYTLSCARSEPKALQQSDTVTETVTVRMA